MRHSHTSIVAAALLSACTLLGPSARADEPMMGKGMADDKMQTTAMAHIDEAKQMAADPAKAEMMAKEMAKGMVIDHMAMEMAKDPQVQQAMMSAMSDPNMMKVHEQAMQMVKDPEQMKSVKQEVMDDPMAMKVVMHEAMKMAMKDKMADGDSPMMGHDMGAPMMGGDKK